MSGPTARNDEQGIDANIIAVAHESRREALSCHCHATQAPFVESHSCGVLAAAGLNLYEGEDAASTGDNVHFASGNPGPPS